MSAIATTAGQTPATSTAGDQTPLAAPAAGQAPAAPAQPAGQAPDDNSQQPERVEDLPEWAQKIIREGRKEAESLRKRNADERRQTEETKLAEQQKWQELAQQRANERDKLAPYKDLYEALAAQQRAALMAEASKWPAEVRDLLPGEDADVTALAEAIAKARPLVAALAAGTAAAPGQGQPPKAAGPNSGDKVARAAFARQVREF